jgi:hypothetical protein
MPVTAQEWPDTIVQMFGRRHSPVIFLNALLAAYLLAGGGGSGIRTLEDIAALAVFKTAALGH